MLALEVETGDLAIRTDLNKTFILKGTDPTELTDWQEILAPLNGIQSINGKTGASVTITTSDVAEGTNLYYTQDRFDVAFAASASTDLSDTADILYKTDTLILNCGNATV